MSLSLKLSVGLGALVLTMVYFSIVLNFTNEDPDRTRDRWLRSYPYVLVGYLLLADIVVCVVSRPSFRKQAEKYNLMKQKFTSDPECETQQQKCRAEFTRYSREVAALRHGCQEAPSPDCVEQVRVAEARLGALFKACDTMSQDSSCSSELLSTCENMFRLMPQYQNDEQFRKDFEGFRASGTTSEILNQCNSVATGVG